MGSKLRTTAILAAAFAIASILVWQGIVAAGNPNPESSGNGLASGALDIAVLVFREGLESILVLAAILAGLRAEKKTYRHAIYAGMGAGFGLGVASWFVATSVVSDLTQSYGALAVQATTGMLAVVVLLVVMNWFFHNIYWSGWISSQNKMKQAIITEADKTGIVSRRVLVGLGLLGFASVYRESVEIVLFLQSYYLRLSGAVVYFGAAGGLVLTAAAGWLTLVEGSRLPYKKMLIGTGVLLTGVLFVMVGEQVNEMQQAGWIATSSIAWMRSVPSWTGTWFSVFPNVQTFEGQALAIVLVAGSYVVHRFRTFHGWNPPEETSTSTKNNRHLKTDS